VTGWDRLSLVTSKKYPLEPLARVRATRTDDAKRELALAIHARELAEKRLRAAEAEREKARAAAQGLRDAERGALERGELSARDLMRADAWEARAKEELAQLERQLDQASAREREARAKEATAKGAVGERRAELGVVEEDRARWTNRERQKEEAKEEEAGAEAWRPKRA
jgi:hypothetical protein